MKILWKCCDNISQLGFFILYIISPFSHFISSIHFFFHFFSSCFSPPHTLSLSLSLPSFIFFFLPHLRTFQHYTSSSHSLSLFIYLFIFTWFQNIRPQRSLDGSSLSQSSWPSLEPSLIFVPNAAQMGQMASVFCLLSSSSSSFIFVFIFMIWLILKLSFLVCSLMILLYLSLEMFEKKIVMFVVVVFVAMRGERKNCFYLFIEMYEFFK